ncbi:MAG: chorismate synthase [Treponema sp.]|jgi:chorismate synthase|nr:chorismate synthase [Treponema sp.]
MSGNSFGTLFTVMTFGESHGPALGCIIDGCPAGLLLETEDIAAELRRRRPLGGEGASTARTEEDEPEILSGVFEGRSLGTPIAIIIRNRDQRSGDYDELREVYRPGHADWTWEAKFGRRDHRGGGRSSGRETAGRVAAGAVAKVFLKASHTGIRSWVSSIAGIDIPGPEKPGFDIEETEKNPFRVPRSDYVKEIGKKIESLRASGDSAGSIVTVSVTGLPPGLGEPVFDKVSARLAQAALSLGGCKGVEFGNGFAAASLTGSQNNDAITARPEDAGANLKNSIEQKTKFSAFNTNNAGGSLGGISTGEEILFRAAFKPVASIGKIQKTVDTSGSPRELSVKGRHDICIAPRAAPVLEAMTALVLADLILLRRANRV